MLEDNQIPRSAMRSQPLEDSQPGQVSTLLLPGLGIDQMPTQAHQWSASDLLPFNDYRAEDSWAVDEMATWVLPAISIGQVPDTGAGLHKSLITDTEGHIAPLRKLLRSSGIYAIAAMAPPMVALVLAPYLTHFLSLSDYGVLTILNNVISLVAGISQLGMASAFFRAYGYDYTSRQDQHDVLATVFTILWLVSIPLALGGIILAPFLATLLFGRAALSSVVAIACIVVLLQNLTVPGFSWLRAESQPLSFALLSISNVLITLLATLVLVGVLRLGIAGSLIATGCGYASVVIVMMPQILIRAGIKMRPDITRSLLAFGLPLVLNYVSYWMLQVSDRYLLSRLGSLEQTARYAIAYTLGSALSVVVMGPFSLAWPTSMFAIAKREDAARVFRLVFRWFSLLLLFAAFGFSLAGRILLDQLFPNGYHSATNIIPIIAASIVLFGAYYVFTVGVNVKRKTWMIAIFTTVGALVNIILNLILIPYFGAMGAAVSTFFAFAALATVAYVVNQRMYPVSFEIGMFLIALGVGAALYVGSDFLTQGPETYLAWALRVCALCLYGGCLALLGKLSSRRD